MEAHTEDHSSPAQSALVYQRTAVAIDSIIYRKALFKIHPHGIKVICGFRLNSEGNDEIFLQFMACPDSLAL